MHTGKNDKKKKGRSIGQAIKLVLQLLFLLFLLAVVFGIFYFYRSYGRTILKLQTEANQLVKDSDYDTFRASQTSLVYDSEGDIISTLKAEKDVYYLEYEDIPQQVLDAMIVSEDKKFFEHGGVDYLANVRAAIALIKHKGEITQGASTITQQLARKVFLTDRVTYERKIEEIFIAQDLEKKYTKTEILEFYINNIYYANGHYGIQAASNGYFDKSINSLSLSQIAFLSAIPNSPNRYNPETNMDNTLKRRDRILLEMYEDKKITQKDYQQALDEKIVLNPQKTDKKNYVETYIYHCAIEALMKRQGFELRNQFSSAEDQQAYEKAYDDLYNTCQQDLFISGYRIYTSIDMEKQKLLQKSVDSTLTGFTDLSNDGVYKLQAAAVTIDNDNGRVIAIVGGRSQKIDGYTFNRGYQSYRQPGSSIKPLIVYTPSFERSYTPDSIVVDEPIEDGPKNSDKKYDGEMKLQNAIERSKNTIAWKLFEELTPTVGLSYLLKMNFAKIDKKDYYPASALGGLTVGVSPVEMASAYSALENDGIYREPTCIIKIMDSEGNEIVGENKETKQIYRTNAARMMTEALMGVIKNGTGKGLGLSNTVSAGKTGTTNDKKDGWFVGYTPYYTTSVWVGYDMPKSLADLAGSSYPGTIWHKFMDQIHDSSMKAVFNLYDWRPAVTPPAEENETLTNDEENALNPAEEGTLTDNEGNLTGEENAADTDNNSMDGNNPIDNATNPTDGTIPSDNGTNPEDNAAPADDGDNSEGSIGEDTAADTAPDSNTGSDTDNAEGTVSGADTDAATSGTDSNVEDGESSDSTDTQSTDGGAPGGSENNSTDNGDPSDSGINSGNGN